MESRPMGVDAEALLEQAGWMRRLAERLVHDPDRADDMTQEAWRIALERKPSFAESPRAWVKSVMQNLARRSHRDEATRAYHERRSARPEATESHGSPGSIGPEYETEERVLLQKRLADAILSLDEPYRSAIRLRYIDGRSPREVAREQGITYEAARRRLSRAVAMLRERLDRTYGNRAAWGAACIALLTRSAPIAGGALVSIKVAMLAATCVGVVILGGVWCRRTQDASRASPQLANSAAAHADHSRLMTPGEAPPESARERVDAVVKPPSVQPHRSVIDRIHDLTGRVLDPRGVPVRGSLVTAFQQELADLALSPSDASDVQRVAETRTDDDGEFAITLPQGRPFDLVVHADRYPIECALSRYAGERVLVTLSPPAAVFGRVVRKSDGTPVIGADVSARSGSERSKRWLPVTHVRTDAGGAYRLDDLTAGQVFLDVLTESDPPPPTRMLVLDPGGVVEADVEIDRGAVIRGLVVDAATKNPIQNALVRRGSDQALTVPRRTVETDVHGAFVYAGFPVPTEVPYFVNGIETLIARASGYADGAAVVCKRGGMLAEFVQIELSAGLRAHGRVLDPHGQPIVGAFVEVRPDWVHVAARMSRTGRDGSFEVAGIEPDNAFWSSHPIGEPEEPADAPPVRIDWKHGRYGLIAHADGFAMRFVELPPLDAEHTTFELGDITLSQSATCSGRVVDESSRGIAGVKVLLAPVNDSMQSRLCRTDEFGRFGFDDVDSGDYRLGTTWACGNSVGQNLSLKSGENLQGVWLQLSGAGETIAGNVRDENGRGVRNVLVIAERQKRAISDPCFGSSTTDATGRFIIRSVASGVYNLKVQNEHEAFGPDFLQTDAPQYYDTSTRGVRSGDRNVVIDVKTRAYLNGYLLDAEGRGVRGARVWFEDASGNRVWMVDISGKRMDEALRTNFAGGFGVMLESNGTFRMFAHAPREGETTEATSVPLHAEGADVQLNVDAFGRHNVILRLPRKQ
jgi:RNA polymerase sigma factor (sigma-70 family)